MALKTFFQKKLNNTLQLRSLCICCTTEESCLSFRWDGHCFVDDRLGGFLDVSAVWNWGCGVYVADTLRPELKYEQQGTTDEHK